MPYDWDRHLLTMQHGYPTLAAFAFNWWHYNMPFLERVRSLVPAGSRVLEVGTGTGALSVLLAAHGYEVLATDADATVLDGARAFAERFGVTCRFEVADGFDLSAYRDRFDLCFSAGLIEHFESNRAAALLAQKAVAAPLVLALAPTAHALRNDPTADASDARPMSIGRLRQLFTDAGLVPLKVFGYGTPGGPFSAVYRYVLPPLAQLYLQNRLSYAATVGCFGRRV